MKRLSFTQIIILILTFGVVSCLVYISNAQLDNRAASLVGIILTLLSIAASYITSQYFAEKGHKEAIEEVKAQHVENLKTYALNASEKVDNLSKELHRLANFLEDELAKEYEDYLHGFRSRTGKIDSAIHIIETLKSVNDTSLSDWRGVIPEELEEKNEELSEREAELKELIDRVEELSSLGSKDKKDDDGVIKHEVDSLRQQIIDVSRRIDGVRIRPKKVSDKLLKEPVKTACPSCKKEIIYKQRPLKSSFKPVACQSCGEKFTARWYEDKGFVLEPNIEMDEKIQCPNCEQAIDVKVPSLIFATKQIPCPHCNAIIKMTRNINDIRSVIISAPKPTCLQSITLTEDIISAVQNAMPPQPWPKGTHRTVIEHLGISNHVFDKAIQELIHRGVFHPQVKGELYYRKNDLT